MSFRCQHAVYAAASRIARELKLKRIMDVGCGPATKLPRLFDERFELYGIDQPEAIGLCHRLRRRGTFVVDDFENSDHSTLAMLPEPDMIISADVIEHLGDPGRLLSYLKGLAAPHTYICLSTPDREATSGVTASSPANPEHVHEWSLREFREYVETAGFRVLEQRRVAPFQLKADFVSARYALRQLFRRRALMATQMVVCRLVD